MTILKTRLSRRNAAFLGTGSSVANPIGTIRRIKKTPPIATQAGKTCSHRKKIESVTCIAGTIVPAYNRTMKLIVKEGISGRGVFAEESIKSGATILHFTGPLLRYQQPTP